VDICSQRQTRLTITSSERRRTTQHSPALDFERQQRKLRCMHCNLFHVLGQKIAKMHWLVEVRVHGTKRATDAADRDWRWTNSDVL